VLREVWEGIGGTDLASLTSSPDFPNRPTSTNFVTDLFEAPVDVHENYGQRLHGYVVPPKSGAYTFWVASDDQGSLFLSTDENPANARQIARVDSWTSSREWEKEPNQRSSPITLTGGKAYYVAALMKEGGGGDNLAVRWLMPDGVDQAPIVATNLLPFGVSFTPPAIARQPANTTTVEGQLATFSIGLSTIGPATYSWRRNGFPIPNSNTPEFAFGPVALTDQGARFSVFITNSIGSATSTEATLTVTPDRTPPTVLGVLNIGTRLLRITFSEAVSEASAIVPARYQFSPAVSVTSARLGEAPHIVELELATLSFGSRYTLTLNGITDRAQSPNAIAAGSTIDFTALEFAPATIGLPSRPGSVTPAAGGVTLGAGGQIGGRSDAFEFAYERITGNFDRRVRVAAFTPTDPFATAGLMARSSLEPNSAFAAALATPGVVGSFFLTRASTGSEAQRSGTGPVNYPHTWLRLLRSGSTFRAFIGFDGTTWSELGSASLNLPATLFLGFAAASHDPARVATVEFREASPISGTPPIVALPVRRESPGPSSRLSALVISEIMYHPRERADGRNSEFIELYNADLIDQDLTGHRISGDVDFSFPKGFVLPAGGFAVIARQPSDLAAVYGLSGALGPFEGTNNLPNSQGRIRLQNPEGAVLLEVEYTSRAPWPVAADGAGPSLVLTRPSYGEGDPRAWSASEFIGGSPGTHEPLTSNPFASVRFNEVLAHTDPPQLDYVELYNRSNDPVELGGCFLTDDPSTNRFRIPDNTRISPRGFFAFNETQLGFRLNAAGESLYLIDPSKTRVVDALRFGPQENGIASGRFPDGTPEWRRLATPSPAAENTPFRVSPVVINEILFHPISDDDDDEFVELHNHSANPVSLAGWSFTDGIDFRFPSNAVITAGGYAVVARNRGRLLANNPALPPASVFGNFSGSLANGGERLALAMPDFIVSTNEVGVIQTNRIAIEINEVTYSTGGQWGTWSDGLGSSLELIDPFSDHLGPSNWADSDESAKASWTTIEFTGRVDNVADGIDSNRLHLLAQGQGEYLIDNVEVLGSDGANRVGNGNFSGGASGWTAQGNHRRSSILDGSGPDGSTAYRIRTTGRGDTAVNRVRTAITPPLAANSTATLRARVRWLRGWPEFLLRTRGNGIEAYARLNLPTQSGTPGAPNSRAIDNAGPAIVDVTHSPTVPRANEAVLVSARVTDPDGIESVTLRHRTDPATAITSVSMRDDGTNGDLVAGDGIYSARITGRAANTLVAFTVRAVDRNATPTTAQFPAPATFPVAADREALVRWGESKPIGNLGVYRFWQRQRDYDSLRSREPLANDPLDCTFVYGDERVIYNAEMRAKGSPWHGGSVGGDYVFSMPDDNRLLGARDLAVVTLGNLGSDPSAQREQAAFWIGRQIGVPTLHRRHIHFFENGGFKGLYEDTEEPNGLYADRWFPEGVNGELFKIEDWFEFNDAGNSFEFTRDATLQRFTTLGGALKQARYRWAWRKRAVQRSANDYAAFLQLVETVANATTATTARIDGFVDIENWMRTFALQHIVGNWDAYGHGRGKNSYLYLPTGGRWKIIPWDIDFVLGSSSDGPTTDVFGSVDPVVTRLWNVPAFRRTYWRAYLDAVQGPLAPENIDTLLNARYAALVANGFNVEPPGSIQNWVRQRRAYLTTRIASEDTPALVITSNNGNDLTTSSPTLALTGRAPIAIDTLLVNGTPYPVTWTSVTNWSLSLTLAAPNQRLLITGLDFRGQLIPGLSDSINVVYSGPLPDPAGSLVINEIHFNPASPGSGFVEIANLSNTTAWDLSGWELDGVGFTFPSGTLLAPGGFGVVAADLAAFRAAHGTTVIPFGVFPGRLQDGGERLRLVRPASATTPQRVIDDLRYDGEPPWPTNAAGRGPSLQLIDARQDNRRPANWGTAPLQNPPLSTPGRVNANAVALDPFPNLWLNEIQSRNLTGPTDQAGERDPWVEIFNAGDTPIDLAGLYLSADPTQLTAWPFPSGTTVGPRQFLIVWCDGETSESSAQAPHASFRLNPTNGVVTLARLQAGIPAALDVLKYQDLPADRSQGSFPDGDPLERFLFHRATPGSANSLATPSQSIVINEWMASNAGVLLDPADGDNDDWFELYNAGTTTADLSGFTLTDDLNRPTLFRIPNGTTLPPGGFLMVWADEETGQSTPGQLHVNFKLAAGGEALGLFAPDGTPVDRITFGPQPDNLTQGRFPDGQAAPFLELDIPTPGQPNAVSSANHPPVLGNLPNPAVDEGETVRFTVTATDSDSGQRLTFSLLGAPPSATLDPASGLFQWVTSETDGPGTYSFSVRVSDNGQPLRSDTEVLTITVRERNLPPVLEPFPPRSVDEGVSITIAAVATDPDRPNQKLTYRFISGAPPGAQLDPDSGIFSWIPTEAQGPGTYAIVIGVSDGATPPGESRQTLNLTVNETDNPPVFEPLSLQSIEESSTLTVTLVARDPDSPPKSITYSIQSAPSNTTLDPSTGIFRWTPPEDAGPGLYTVTVRATETGSNVSSTFTFSISVTEKNEAPVLAKIPDFEIQEGSTVQFTAQVTDSDLPAQRLSFRLEPGAPPDASVDPQSGVFTWTVDPDAGPSTNRLTLTVTDNGIEPRSTSQSFQIVVGSFPKLVIHEIQYAPAIPNTEFVEVYNRSARTSWSLAGWRLTGLDFTFPANTVIGPTNYLVVARNRSAFQAAYRSSPSPLGDASVSFSPEGQQFVRLQRPSTGASTLETIDEVAFHRDAPWPAQANGRGPSLQVIDANQDNQRVANWSAVLGTSTNAPLRVVQHTNVWRFKQDGAAPANWRETGFNDASWPSGRGLLYVEDAALLEPKSTALTRTEGRFTYYFRTRFNFSGNPEGAALLLHVIVDDGAVVHLNGSEIFRIGIDTVPTTDATPASRTVSDAIAEGPFSIPVTQLVTGENVLAVEVHQINATSSDIVWGASVDVLEVRRESSTPGYANSVRSTLAPFPEIWIHEVLPRNVSGITDNAGDRDPWIEIAHRGTQPVDLAGWWLTDDFNHLAKWPFPASATIGANTLRLVWADAEPSEQTDAHWHTSFRFAPQSGRLALVRTQNGAPAVVDFVTWNAVPDDRSLGILSPLDPLSRGLLSQPTPGQENVAKPPEDDPIRILEVHRNAPSEVTLVWSATIGRRYAVEWRASWDQPWTSLPGEIRASKTVASAIARDLTTPQAYFRIRRIDGN